VLLIAAIAGVMLHVPAGLGVTEAVFVAMLSHKVPEHQLIGALLAFRALFYLLPLVVVEGMGRGPQQGEKAREAAGCGDPDPTGGGCIDSHDVVLVCK
jgi:hypothetical protein